MKLKKAGLSSAWIEHTPNIPRKCGGNPKARNTRHEPGCKCGTDERHEHCLGCGRIASKGDWDAKPIMELTLGAKGYFDLGFGYMQEPPRTKLKRGKK